MDWLIMCLLLFFALVLVVLGFLKNQSIIILFSGIAFMLFGVLLWTGISHTYVFSIPPCCDANVTQRESFATTTYVYDGAVTPLLPYVSTFFVLFGLFLVLVSGISVFSGKEKIVFTEDEEED